MRLFLVGKTRLGASSSWRQLLFGKGTLGGKAFDVHRNIVEKHSWISTRSLAILCAELMLLMHRTGAMAYIPRVRSHGHVSSLIKCCTY